MAVDIYSKTAWNNGTAPSLSETQLNHIETGIKNNNTAIISLQSVQAECENYASESEASKIASANSATSASNSALSALASANTASNSALSALASANTAKAEADRAVAVAGVDIATDLVAGLVRGGGNVEVDVNGDMNVPIANNLTTAVEGYVLDARQGKALNDSLTYNSAVEYKTNYFDFLVCSKAGIKRIFMSYYRQIETALVAETFVTLTTLPEKFRPICELYKVVNLSSSIKADLRIQTNGIVTIRSFTNIPVGTYVIVDELFI